MSEVTPNLAFWILFFIHWLLYFFDQWIKWRQYNLHLEIKTCPSEIREYLTDEEFTEGRKRALKIDKFNFLKDLIVHVAFMAVFFTGLLPVIWKWIDETNSGENVNNFRLFLVVLVVTCIVMIPFILDRNCWNDKSKSGYDTDNIMWFIFGDIPKNSTTFARGMLLFAFAIWLGKKFGDHFYLYLWGISAIIVALHVSVVYIFSFILAPCLSDNKEMPETPLKQEILSMTEKCKHPMTKITLAGFRFCIYRLTFEFIKQFIESKYKSGRNAYIFGFPNNRKMGIFDKLLKRGNTTIILNADGTQKDSNNSHSYILTTNEILALLAHEIYFWNSKLPLFILFIGIPYLFICYFFFSLLYQNPYLFESFGFPSSQPLLIGIILTLVIIFPIFNRPIAKFIRTYFRRRSILAADKFAAKYGYSEALASGLIKMNKDLEKKDIFPINDILYSNYFCPHPTIFDRIHLLKKIGDSRQTLQLNEINAN